MFRSGAILLLATFVFVNNASGAMTAPELLSAATLRPSTQSAAGRVPTKSSLFIFHTDEFWLNLHHFLYVLGRAQNKSRDAGRDAVVKAPADQDRGLARLSEKERTVWREAVAWYAANLSQKDLIFDDELAKTTSKVAAAGSAKTPIGIDADLAAVLGRAAPIYRKAWWREHQAANRAWVEQTQPLLKKYGPPVLQFILKIYQTEWPAAGYPVHVCGYTNWAGAYSTVGKLLVVSGLYDGIKGLRGLETVFHESMHQWDDQIDEALNAQAKPLGQTTPRDLSHALIFYTAGEAVRRIVPGYVPFAESAGIWQRGPGRFKTSLDEIWKPYLDGHGTRGEAFAELIRRSTTD